MVRWIGKLSCCALALVLSVAESSHAQPLPLDPALTMGELDNGLRYVIRRHNVPAGRAALWIHIHSGSSNETESQRGIAHYLEHMAFNGSENFSPGSLVPFFESRGMTFGRDQNAFTSFEQTTYQLSLPAVDSESLGKGMTFFADVVGRLSLLPSEIEAERQIIQEERRRGLSARQRTSDYVQERIAPGSLYATRDPIGTEQTIDSVKEADFRDYYGKWYGAANATLIVVADADQAETLRVIQSTFGALPKKLRPTPQPVGVKAYEQSFAIIASDPELKSEDVRITRIEPARAPVTQEPQYREELVARVGVSALNQRLSDKAATGATSYSSARASLGNRSNALYQAEISGRPSPGKWKATLAEIALELQRARTFGFSAHEIDNVKKELLASAERAVETESTEPMSALVSRINNDIAAGEPTLSPKQRLELLRKQLSTVTREEVGARFANEFNPAAVAFVATLPAGPHVPTEAQLLELGRAALAVAPTPEVETVHAAQLMAELPKPGAVIEGSEHAASRVWSGWLSNNVRVVHRAMDDRKNEVNVRIALIGGEILERADDRGITSAAQLAWSRPATRKLSSTDIREIMTGKKVDVRGSAVGGGGGGGRRRGGGGGRGGGDAISLSISGSNEELETGFQLAYLLLTEPRIETAAFTQFLTSTRENLEEALSNPMALGARCVTEAIYPDGEVRLRPLASEQLDRLTMDAAQTRLEKLTRESPIEVTIVGDIARERALELAARYLGALPPRERVSPASFAALRQVKRPAGPRVVTKTIDTPTEQAFVYSGFYGADESNVGDTRALTMAARILSTRMVKEVREQEQLVYSIGATSRMGSTYPGFGVVSASAPTDPPKVKTLVAKLAAMYEHFAKEGPTAEELEVAKRQMATTFSEQMKDPSYWSGRLSQLTFRGASCEEIVDDPAAYQALSAQQVREVFAKHNKPENAIVVTVAPKSGVD